MYADIQYKFVTTLFGSGDLKKYILLKTQYRFVMTTINNSRYIMGKYKQ